MYLNEPDTTPDRATGSELLICFSHLRWDFVTQRPQHLMTRFAANRDVVFWEEPLFDADTPHLETRKTTEGVVVAVPHLCPGMPADGPEVRALLDGFLSGNRRQILRWYYTPMMVPLSRHIDAVFTVYDCMDELANFAFAPPGLLDLESELLGMADLVFTGGHSLYEAKRGRHDSVYPFPSSVDVAHFQRARSISGNAGTPTIGYYGVIDERIDLNLIAAVADARPDWRIEMVGPVVKISADDLPLRQNIEWLGRADYSELPKHIANWDVAIMPFAINAATRFISPTKTPEYLAGGKPVVSTAIVDVARHYGKLEGVSIAENAESFINAIEASIPLGRGGPWLNAIDAMLSEGSWDQTFTRMNALIARHHGDRALLRRAKIQDHYDVLVVGAGFAGSVMAERLATDAGLKVLVVDRRDHIAGNAYDRRNEAGLLIHQYGPHIFHTNSEEVVTYLSRFTKWRPYEHRVLADVRGQQLPVPINRTTINLLYGLDLQTEAAAAAFLAEQAEPVAVVQTSEDVVVSAVGRELYETFFRGYTRKQWGLDPSELDKSVTARVPTRTNIDDRYFTDTFQAMPAAGYTAMFANMLDHPNITVQLGTDYRTLGDTITFDRVVYTGPIDEFYDHRFGKLPYRSLRFQHETLPQAQFQPVATVNYPSEEVPWTRITEYAHLTGECSDKTSITYEFPCDVGDPYYPVPRAENESLYRKYRDLADAERNVTFVGRLATYRYYNMDQVVAQALASYRKLAGVKKASQEMADAA